MADRIESSGERQGHREAMDRMTRQLIEAGNRPEYAERKAREAAIRHDTGEGHHRRQPR